MFLLLCTFFWSHGLGLSVLWRHCGIQCVWCLLEKVGRLAFTFQIPLDGIVVCATWVVAHLRGTAKYLRLLVLI